jgi:hypothetical protein
MKAGGLLAACAAVLFLAPFANAEVPLVSPDQERRVKEATPPSGKALIYLYRGDTAGATPELPVWMNKRFMGKTAPRTFFVWAAQAGRYVIAGSEDGRDGLVLQIEPGQNYFVQQDVRIGEPGQSQFSQVSLATGRYAIIGRRLIDAGLAAKMPVQAPPTPTVAKESVSPPPPASSAATPDLRVVAHRPWSLRLRAGSFSLSDTSQTLVGIPVEFDAGASGVMSVEAEYQQPDGLALGVELLRFSNDLEATGSSSSSTVEVSVVAANIRKYFSIGRSMFLSVGAGIGGAGSEFSGDVVEGGASGLAMQLMAGIEYRFDRAALTLDYRYLSAKTEDGDGNEADVSGAGLLAGVAVRF